jgi:hypothetical protein
VAEIVSHSLKSLWETIVRVVDPVMMLDIVLVTSCDVPPINQSVWDPKKMISNMALLVANRVSHCGGNCLTFFKITLGNYCQGS